MYSSGYLLNICEYVNLQGLKKPSKKTRRYTSQSLPRHFKIQADTSSQILECVLERVSVKNGEKVKYPSVEPHLVKVCYQFVVNICYRVFVTPAVCYFTILLCLCWSGFFWAPGTWERKWSLHSIFPLLNPNQRGQL